MEEQDISLREKKHIKTKVALMNAFIERLQTTRLGDISIKEVCQSVEVSESTFFNYFPSKADVVYYFHQLFDYKIVWKTRQEVKSGYYLDLIDAFFQNVVREFPQAFLIYEIISVFTGEKQDVKKKDISPAEIAFALPDCPGIEIQEDSLMLIKEFFSYNIKQAILKKELPERTNLNDAVVSLIVILVGSPLALDRQDFNKLAAVYKKQLNLLWKALGRL